ncbi:MAG: hypothetical protein IT372_27855, partial [Polyangiaceae bacterium]|nr:hypothetical protein [Polyangiaceae bacterium]
APPRPRWVPLAAALGALAIAGVLVLVLVLARRRAEPETEAPAAPEASAAEPAPPPEPAPTATASAPADVDGIDVEGWRARFKKAVAIKNWVLGADALLALAELDPKLVAGEELRRDVVAVAAGIGFERDSEIADKVFDLLTNGLDQGGLDVLFDIVRSRGSTKAGRRAGEILARPDVLARATPALRVTFEFRRASCSGRRAMFERAAEEGDERTLFDLQVAHDAKCKNRKDPCCFRDDEALAEAIRKLKARLGG